MSKSKVVGRASAARVGAGRRLGLTAVTLVVALVALVGALGCRRTVAEAAPAGQKIGVLLVSHGSRSATWRQALTELDARVRDRIMEGGRVAGVRSAFMEYNEPSIATRLKELDAEGFTDVVVVPIFLTVSPHPFDDIPTIMGKKTDPQSLETMKVEGIERYVPRARTHLTPLLDVTDLLQKNVLRRAKSLSTAPEKEGLVLIAYGDETYEREWGKLLEGIGAYVRREAGIGVSAYGWCGHLVHYDPGKTTAAIEKVLAERDKAIVVPVLVAHDERFQVKLIGEGIARVANAKERVVYKPDSILPDPELERWVVDTAREHAEKAAQAGAAR
jgi:hypothetical protein